jgi:hypothetical protein
VVNGGVQNALDLAASMKVLHFSLVLYVLVYRLYSWKMSLSSAEARSIGKHLLTSNADRFISRKLVYLAPCFSSHTRIQVLKDIPFDVAFPEISRSVFDLQSVGDIIVGI